MTHGGVAGELDGSPRHRYDKRRRTLFGRCGTRPNVERDAILNNAKCGLGESCPRGRCFVAEQLSFATLWTSCGGRR